MAYQNKIICNPKNGQDIRFVQTAKETGGLLLELESTYHGRSKEPPMHYHPRQEELFTVLEGAIHVRTAGKLRVVKAGESLRIPKGSEHSMWNGFETRAVVNWKIQPALDTEYFLETTVGLAASGRTNAAGIPGVLQIALLANRFSHVFRLSQPAFAIQKLVFLMLTPLAYLRGYRPVYKEYLD